MTVIAKVAAFAAVLVAVFAISVWVGGTFGPHPDIAVPHPPSTSDHLPSHGEARP